MKLILRYLFVCFVIALGVMLTTYAITPNQETSIYEIQVKELSNKQGWYYEIYKEKKIIIKQESIPGISGFQNFKSERDAQKIAELVVQKLKHQITPSITPKELKICNIHFKNH
ncbi:hypothetical protein AB832_03640 [Flavobacteriaceae bacterium (ex Bugula neritina AB1)]|nr:hypothetical protein AB832_03640 [Flavobacteriaceae bacterium (ex Bugula neritina AB1)]